MKEIHIGRILAGKRREKGITQDEVACHMGVSKAAVSKWETDMSYPDITLLPQLAAYFNISIDEMMGYEPQMTKEDIRSLYHRLAADFSTKPFAEVMEECEMILHKYYACYPLLLQMSGLLLNHAQLSEKPEAVYERVLELCNRIRKEGDEVWLQKEALLLEVNTCLVKNEPDKVLELMGETIRPRQQGMELLAMAYQMKGQIQKADEVLQICTYQNLSFLFSDMVMDMAYMPGGKERTGETIRRAVKLLELFAVERLHMNIALNVYMAAAQAYVQMEQKEQAYKMLEKYVVCCGRWEFPVTLHGDAYFDRIDDWINDFDLGKEAPCSQDIIRQRLITGMTENPALVSLAQEERFCRLVKELKQKINEKGEAY